VTFDARLAERTASDYADFLIRHLAPTDRVLDAGCGEGAITPDWLSTRATSLGSTSMRPGSRTLAIMQRWKRRWLEWARAPDAYAAFAWCRAVGFKPGA
jgi:hypothetical protein